MHELYCVRSFFFLGQVLHFSHILHVYFAVVFIDWGELYQMLEHLFIQIKMY